MSDPIHKTPCWRCGEEANPGGGWEGDWPMYGQISVGFGSRLLDYLFGNGLFDSDGRVGEMKSPLVKKWDWQQIHLSWGAYKESDYILCRGCQAVLLRFLGDFFFTETHAKIISEGKPWAGAPAKARIKQLENEVAYLKGQGFAEAQKP